MKKPGIIYFWIISFLFTNFSCSDEIENPNHLDIVGTWEMHIDSQDDTLGIVYQYKFFDNSQMELNKVYKEKGTSEISGYHSSFEGTYILEGNVFTPYFSQYFYREPESTAIDLKKEELIKEATENQFVASYNFVFNENKDEVTFFVICPPNAKCTGGGTYKKTN